MKNNTTLRMESPAPPIKVENWLRGKPLTNFRSGKVYLVEFWATWCAPCVAAMPHLMQLQETFRDRGLEVVGVAASERAATTEGARSGLDAWLTNKFPNLNFPIAFDSTGEMKKLWMEPSLSTGIPTSFMVDRDGHIAFIGDPTDLDNVLPKVLNGSWRSSDEAKAADKERIAKQEPKARRQALRKPILAKYGAAVEKEDWKTALSAIEEGIALVPDDIDLRLYHVHLVLNSMQDIPNGLRVMHKLVRDAIARHSEHWMTMALDQLFHPWTDHSRIPSDARFAMGKRLSEHILALDPARDQSNRLWSYPAVARYYRESGDKERAIDLIELALKSLPEPVPDDVKKYVLPGLLQMLANYKGEKVCHGSLCVAPQNNDPETVAS